MDDLLITSAKPYFAATKNREYRARVLLLFRVFIDFLQDNELVTREILTSDQPVTAELEIRKSDLNEDGFALIVKAHSKWMRAMDRGTEITDVRILEKALAKIRNSKP